VVGRAAWCANALEFRTVSAIHFFSIDRPRYNDPVTSNEKGFVVLIFAQVFFQCSSLLELFRVISDNESSFCV